MTNMKIPNKHVPVMLQEVLEEFEKINSEDSVTAIDCTLGQAGHSIEIFKKLRKGVLLSIDTNLDSIEWVSGKYEMQGNKLIEADKFWELIHANFSDLDKILEEHSHPKFDFLLADLGFSNYQMQKNLGISYSMESQNLDMRYDKIGLKASDFINSASSEEMSKILSDYGQIEFETAKRISLEIIRKRKLQQIQSVKDLNYIIKKFGEGLKVKIYQAIRSFINQEPERLRKLLRNIKSKQSVNGVSLIISFNQMEEKIINDELGDHLIKEPNINELITNTQSRSAKLHIYKQKIN